MLEAKRFESIRALEGISEKTMTEHYKLYEGYVKKTNEIIEKLESVDKSAANQAYSEIRALKVDLSFALGGVKNHELYFENLGGKGGEPTGRLAEAINKDFGSFEKWKEDMKATAMAGRGWAWLAYDFDLNRLINFIGDAQNSYPIWFTFPFVALDVYEHAYYLDFATKRADYIDAYFNNLNWPAIQDLFERNIPA